MALATILLTTKSMRRCAWAAIGLSSALLLAACRRQSQSQTVVDAGVVSAVPNDTGSADPYSRICPPQPPADGGISWEAGVPASLVSVPGVLWTRVSQSDECSALTPRTTASELTWLGPSGGASCDPALVNGAGDLAIYSLSGNSEGFHFVNADGVRARYAEDSRSERVAVVAASTKGFQIVRRVMTTECDYSSDVQTDAPPAAAALIDGPRTSNVYQLAPNPRAGYVEAREQGISGQHPDSHQLELRWVDDNLEPEGDWHTAVTWPVNTEDQWRVSVDQLGRAFVLSFNFPPTLGSPPVPSSWTFSARWMDVDGPMGDAFTPVAPTYIAPDGRTFFADWDVVRPLGGSGIAVFHWPNGGPGALSNSGWYAFYPSGLPGAVVPPAWLSSYDGSLTLVADGRAYAALRRDPVSCARTVSLISLSGTTCYETALPDSALCGTTDGIQADGTVIVQGGCPVRWWPQVAGLLP
jgi:hypothetical protein